MQDLSLARKKGAPCGQQNLRDVAKQDNVQYQILLGLGNSGTPLRKHDVKMNYR